MPAADRGSCPYLVTLENGIVVCAYARPGGWLIFSDDNGQTWKGAFEFTSSDSYCNVVQTDPNKILVVYYGGNAVARPPEQTAPVFRNILHRQSQFIVQGRKRLSSSFRASAAYRFSLIAPATLPLPVLLRPSP